MGGREMSVRVGVIGAGIMGADHVRTVQRSVRGASVTMIADVNLGRAEQAARIVPGAAATSDSMEVVASRDVDAVLIASHDSTHADLAVAAIGVGKPVLCEKPLAPTVADCARVVRAEDDALAGTRRAPLLCVGFMRRFDPGYQEMKAAIAGGVCGIPLTVRCCHRSVRSVEGATTESSITGSAAHEFDIVPWLLGQPVVSVSWHSPGISALAGMQDPQLMLLHTADGVLATVETLLNARYGYDIRCEVIGDRGSVSLSHGGHLVVDSERTRTRSYPPDWRLRFADAYRLELQEWIDSIRAGRASALLATARDGLAAAVIAEAAIRSMTDGGRTVAVPACSEPSQSLAY